MSAGGAQGARLHASDGPESSEAIFQRASDRAKALGLPYAGALTPREAHALKQAGAAAIVDVRTQAEWDYVGRVPDTELIEWRKLGERTPNPQFIEELAARHARDEPLLFLCRSAVRSHHAADAATRAGFQRSYNILEGFEGDLDAAQQRGNRGGWRAAGLPWIQS